MIQDMALPGQERENINPIFFLGVKTVYPEEKR